MNIKAASLKLVERLEMKKGSTYIFLFPDNSGLTMQDLEAIEKELKKLGLQGLCIRTASNDGIKLVEVIDVK